MKNMWPPIVSMILGFSIAILLVGCGTGHIRAYNYSWGQILVMDHNTLSRSCASEPGHWDDGTYRPRFASVNGCYLGNGTIAIEDSCNGAEALVHEFAHLDGHDDPKSDGYQWEQ